MALFMEHQFTLWQLHIVARVLAASEDMRLGQIRMGIKADLLKGKRVAGDTRAQKAGATISTAPVEQDGKIITAINTASQKFAEIVAGALTAGPQ